MIQIKRGLYSEGFNLEYGQLGIEYTAGSATLYAGDEHGNAVPVAPEEISISTSSPSDDGIKLWIDTYSGGSNVDINADTLNGHNGDYYTNLNNCSGILSVSNGGTGVNSISALKSALGVPNISYGIDEPTGGQNGDIYFQYFD